LWGLAALGLVLRLLHVRSICGALGTAQIHDAAYYHDVALMMLGHQKLPGLETKIPFANLGYAYVLKWLYAVLPSPTFVLVLQAMLGAMTVVLTGLAGRDIFHRREIGLWAAGLYACYVPSIFYDGMLLIPSLSAFLSASLAWLLCRTLRRRSWRFGVLAGLAIGLAAILRMSQLLLLPFALLTLHRLGGNRHRPRLRPRLMLALFLGTAFAIAPIVLHQRIETGAWVPVTSNGGMNFWIGNHRGATGHYAEAPFLQASRGGDFRHTVVVERDGFLAEARRRSGDPTLSLAQSSGFWWRETWREIAAAPAAWLAVMLRKLWLTTNNYEVRTNASIDLIETIAPVLRWNPLGFGVLVLLAAFGTAHLCGRRYLRARWMSLALIAPPWLTCIVFFLSGEYRHPAAPALAILAGFALYRIHLAANPKALVRLLAPLPRCMAIVLVAVAAFFPASRIGPAKDRKAYAESLAMPSPDGRPPTFERYAMARRLLSRHGESPEDRLLSSEAMLLVESNQAIQFQDRDAAERLVQVASELWKQDLASTPELPATAVDRIRRNLVRRVVQLCRQRFVAQWAGLSQDLLLLGCHSWQEVRSLLDRRMLADAQALLDKARDKAPHSVEVLAYRGELEWLRGNDAMPWLTRSLRGYPKVALPALLAAKYALAEGDVGNALRYAQEALQREPTNRSAQELTLRLAQGQTSAPSVPLPGEGPEQSPRHEDVPPSAQLARSRARALLRDGNYDQAVTVLQAAVRQGPYDEGLHYALGNLMVEHASPEATVAFFSSEAARDEKPQTSHYFMALGRERMGDPDGAVAELRRALAIDPAHEMSQRQWGLLLERQGKLQPALEHLLEATRIHPEYRPALLDAARLAERLGRPVEGADLRERARVAEPSTPRRFLYWARYLHEHGRETDALQELARLQEFPDDVEALELRRVILHRVRRPQTKETPCDP
jgi:tetratricopeptide (TPR) repeat protein